MFKMQFTKLGEQQMLKILNKGAKDVAEEIFSRSQENLFADDKVGFTRQLTQDAGVFPWGEGYEVVYNAPHAGSVEYGAMPHTIPLEERMIKGKLRKVPVGLYDWVRYKIEQDPIKALSISFAIRTEIAKNGVSDSPFLRPAVARVINESKLKNSL